MFDKKCVKKVKILIDNELTRANKMFPLFHSSHEAYAVIREEFEETQNCLNDFEGIFTNYWENIKDNSMDSVLFLRAMKQQAENVALESIQLAAMCLKAIDSEEQEHHDR